MSDVTRILTAIEQGDPHAAEQLLPLVYDELRKLAAQKMAQEKPGQTLEATALVHEAYLRLVGNQPPSTNHQALQWNSRQHFFAAAAEAMRHILIDQARRKLTVRHGGGRRRVPLDDLPALAASPDGLLALDGADVSFHDYEGTGSFFTSMTCLPEKTQQNLSIVRGIFRQVQKDGVTPEELAQAKSKVLSRVVRASERPMGRMQALGMSWTYLGKYRSMDDELKAFEAVTLKKIQQVLDEYPFEAMATLALGPLKKLRKPR